MTATTAQVGNAGGQAGGKPAGGSGGPAGSSGSGSSGSAGNTGAAEAALGRLLASGLDAGMAFLRKIDPDAAADLDRLRRREVTRSSFVVVGETKRGKSSLVNALIGVPNLSPVDAAVATAA